MNSRLSNRYVYCLCKYPTLLFLLFSLIPRVSIADVIFVNRPSTIEDGRYDYPRKLLTAILKETEIEYGHATIKETQLKMPRDRILRELEKGLNIHVIAEASKLSWEQRLIPIRIPIRKGIQGYRTFLIKKKNQPILSKINTLEELKKIPTGSGVQWSTTDILEKNGFIVKTGNNYKGLFSMLIKDRFMTFGRGINETAEEYNSFKDKFPELSIEQDLLLYIPLPTYFFVSPHKPELAKRIEAGLQLMISDGSFDKMFNDEFSELIDNANLTKRRIFRITNPNLSPQTPLDIKHYWYSLDNIPKEGNH